MKFNYYVRKYLYNLTNFLFFFIIKITFWPLYFIMSRLEKLLLISINYVKLFFFIKLHILCIYVV